MMNIVYTCQDNYAQFAGVSIFSLLENNKTEAIHIYFLDSGLAETSRKKMQTMCSNYENVTIDFFPVTDLLNKYSEKLTAFQNNFATYAKLFIELLLPKNIDKCLYIDADTLILSNLSSLYNNKNDYTLYMGYDVVFPKHKKKLGMNDDSSYFNAGVILINLDLWREKKYSERIIQHLIEGHSYLYGDQDIFNVLFINDIGVFEFGNNVITQFFYYKTARICKIVYKLKDLNFYSDNDYRLSKINIIHFTNMTFILRPWVKHSNHPYAKQYINLVYKSPYSEDFQFQNFKQPVRRSIIQFLSYGKKNYLIPIIVGELTRIFKS